SGRGASRAALGKVVLHDAAGDGKRATTAINAAAESVAWKHDEESEEEEPAGGAADRLVACHRAVAHLGVHSVRAHATARGDSTRGVAQGHVAADGAARDAEVRGCRGAKKRVAKIELVIYAAACGPEGENGLGYVAADGAVGDGNISRAGPDAAA